MLHLNSYFFTDRSHIPKPQLSSINLCSDFRYSIRSITPNSLVSFSNHIFFPVNTNIRKIPLFTCRCGALVLPDSCRDVRAEKFRENRHMLDDILSGVEIACLASSCIVPLWFAMNRVLPTLEIRGAMALQIFFMLSTVAIGVLIRRLQWNRIQWSSVHNSGVSGSIFRERMEKIEDETGRANLIIRAISRHVEKLRIRFRVTRKSLKGSISEATSLATKNSDITQALVERDRNLENEIIEIQGALLAMQEQQKKQLDLILEMGKSWKRVGENNPINAETPNITAEAKTNLENG